MRIINDWPPNIDAIRAAFPIEGREDVIFSYGDRVYAPCSQVIHQALQAHERVHCERQLSRLGGVEDWGRDYIADPAFRLAEEIPAHLAEYIWWAGRPGADRPIDGFRSVRLFHLTKIAQRLASPLYGGLLSLSDAKKAIEGA